MATKFLAAVGAITGFVAPAITIVKQFDLRAALVGTSEVIDAMHESGSEVDPMTLPGVIGLVGGIFALCGTALGTFLHQIVGRDESTFLGQFMHYLVCIAFFVSGVVFLLVGVSSADSLLRSSAELAWPIGSWAIVSGLVGAFAGPLCDCVYYGGYGNPTDRMPSLSQSLKWFGTMGLVFGILVATGYVALTSRPMGTLSVIHMIAVTTGLSGANGLLTGIIAFGLGGIGKPAFLRYREEVWTMFAGAVIGAAGSFLVAMLNGGYRSVGWLLSALAIGPYVGALFGFLLHALIRDRLRRVIMGREKGDKAALAYVSGMKLVLYPVLIVPWGMIVAVGMYLAR